MSSRLITGLTPTREQAYQERVMLRLARDSEIAIRREVARAYRDIARNGEDAIQLHEERMNRILTSLYNAAFGTFGRRMWNATQKSRQPHEQKREAVPLTPQFDLARRLWIAATAAYKVTEIAGTTLSQAQEIIREATAEAVELGLGEAETAALIQRRVGELGGQLSRLRSRIISRTESHAASNASTQMAAKASGLPMQKEWIASGGERTRETHVIAHGQKVGIDDPFTVGGALLMQPGDVNGPAKEVINCFSGDTKVSFDSLKKSIRSLYSGKIITVKTARGHKLTGTPNHPVMTDSGFIRLDEVNHSTNLLCCDVGMNLTRGLDVYNTPATFEQVHNSLSVIGVSMGVAAIPVNLYGRAVDSNIDVVRSESLLRGNGVTKLLEAINESNFVVASLGKTGLLGNSLLNCAIPMKLSGLCKYGFMRRFNLLGSLLGIHFGPFDRLRFGLVSNMDSVFSEKSSYNISANAEFCSDGVFTDKFVNVHSLDVANGDVDFVASHGNSSRAESFEDGSLTNSELFSYFNATKSRFVHVDNAVDISCELVHNFPVYTLETQEGLYSAGGVISRNCRCVVGYSLE